MSIYVYAVYTPCDLDGGPPIFAGAWEKYDDAVKFTGSDYQDGADPGPAKWRIVQLYFSRAA